MLDIGWTELLLIAVVAIVVIGPKELPEALRSLGRMTTRLRRMAGEFQSQFNQALREANLEDVKRDFDSIRQSASSLGGGFNPMALARDEIRGAITGSAVAPSAVVDTALTSSAAVSAAPPSVVAEPETPPEPIPSAFATSSAFKR
ncbi:Sec-independent protein translocase protein TatB [Labrys wisconsinensis]|uniref:Sec-independent protein translocase protein TatB n=1 Tax=Labrys wisconsinensis TaxID=425677 RepID=UPI0027D88CDE|nr:Sec-independent protein translocase protein TatB [Labrys wisconsinensis]